MKPHIIDFLKYLESKENKKAPLVAKLLYPDKFSPITEEELYVEGDLYLQRSKIKSLPDNLTIEGNLDLSFTKIQSLPDNLKVTGFINLRDTQIESLPDNLLILASLNLERTRIQSIPNNLQIGGSLYIGDTPLELMSSGEIEQEIERKGGYIEGSIHSTLFF